LEIPLHYNAKGPKKIFTNYQSIALIILYIRSKKSLRIFLEEFRETQWPRWLGLREIPSKSTLHDWFKLFKLSTIRKFLGVQIMNSNPNTFAIDATGIDSWKRSRHYEKRIGLPPTPYAKADLLVDTETLIIYDWTLRLKPRHDTIGAKSMIKRMPWRDVLILGDKAYDSEPLQIIAEEKHVRLFAPIRKSSRKNPRGKLRKRNKILHKHYSKRNSAESLMHALKTLKPELRMRVHYMKKREFGWTIILFNMIRMIKIENKIVMFIIRELLFWTDPKIRYIYIS
jgi:hypothetical protein